MTILYRPHECDPGWTAVRGTIARCDCGRYFHADWRFGSLAWVPMWSVTARRRLRKKARRPK